MTGFLLTDRAAGCTDETCVDHIGHIMSESFADLFEESLKEIDMQPGSIVQGTIVDVDNDWVTVNAGLKSEGVIPASQFLNEKGELEEIGRASCRERV